MKTQTIETQPNKMKTVTILEILEVSEGQWDCTIESEGKRMKVSRLWQHNRPSATHLAEYLAQHPASFQPA